MSTQPSQKPTIAQLYNQGDFIDAKDNQGDWRVGYIITKSSNTQFFKVRFDGWASKYDEYYKFSSQKLKPFRTHVIGYTGQKQNSGLRESWKFTPQSIQERIKALQNFMSEPKQFTVHHMNQLIRGHNYHYVDFLMTTKFTDSQSFALVIKYFMLNIEFLVSYLNLIQQKFAQYMKEIAFHKDLEDMAQTQAYYFSFYQIFDTIYILFGNYQRFEGFFKNNEEIIQEHFSIQPSRDYKKFFKQELSKHLIELKGIYAINRILQLILKKQDCVPFFFLSSFTHLLEGVVSHFMANYRQNLLENLLKIGEANVKRLKDSQIKQLHRSQVSTFIEALTSISIGTKYSEAIQEWATMLELSLSLRMILCPYFQRKLKGISHIIQVCERHEALISKNDHLRIWMSKNSLFEILFQMNDNLQIIKKSCEMTKFLVLRNLLRPQDIDIIWNSRVGKHETVIKQIYSLIGEIPYYEKNVNENIKLFKKVSNVPKDQWDEDYIHMIRQFSQNSYGFNARENMGQTFGFEMIYQYALKSGSDFAIGELVSLMNYFEHSQIFNKFQETCFIEISKRNKEKTYIKILLSLCRQNIQTFSKLELSLISILIDHLLINCNSKDSTLISDSFDLLLGVTKNTSKEIQIDLFISLWNGFITSVNKSVFLNWLYKKKQNGRIYLSFCLTDNLKKYLLINLWNKEQSCYNIDEDEAIFIIQLFKYSNQHAQKIKKMHPMALQILSPELQGYNILWTILKVTNDDRAAIFVCDFLAQIYTSYEQSLIEQAISYYAKNLIRAIKDSLASKNWNYLIRLLTLIKKTIDFDDQIYPVKHVPRHHFLKQYTILRKDTQEESTVKFNCTSNFYEFKKYLSAKIGIPLHKFLLVSSKGVKLTRQHFYKTMIEPPLTGGKFQLLLKDEKSLIKASFNKYLDLLFNLLDDNRIQKLVWSIVERLPISEELKLKVTKTQNIFYELQHVGFYKQLYMLKVMLQLSDNWWLKLSKTKRITEILPFFKKITFKTQIEEQYVIALTNIIMKILKTASQHPQIQIPNQMFSNIIPVLAYLFTCIEKEGSKNLESQQKIIKNIFQIADILSDSQNVIGQIINNQNSENLFNAALITIPIQQIRKTFVDEFKILLKYWNPEKQPRILSLLLDKLLFNAINFKNKENLKEYFMLASHILSKSPSAITQSFYKNEAKGLVYRLFDLIKKEKAQQTNESINKSLEGYLTLLKHLIGLQDQKVQNQVLAYLVNECLFSQSDPKCKSSPSRRQGFSVLLQLSQNDKNISAILPYLTEMHKRGHWRSKRFEDWGITLNDKLKSSAGYVGLKNLGCICYMNSFMQQLFMIPYFRYSITNADETGSTNIKPDQNVLYQVQKMFMNLQYSEKKYYNPKEFCHSFKDYQGNPTNVTQQMDIDQYSNILFDRLENQLKSTQYSTLIKDMFGGIFSNQIVCKGCPHYSQSQEPFLSISLTVKTKKNIYQSFQNMIKGDTLDGDNAYYCQRCSKKVTAVKRMSLKKLPNYLIMTLKRFQFDYQKMMKLKVNDFCEFPLELNLKEYSQHYLRKKQNSKTIEEEEDFSSDYFTYVLKGFVVHLGHADSGHYYSFIQDRLTNKWYQFNDTLVKDFDISDLAQEAFGGETGGYDTKQKIKNAYMVIYERQKKISTGNQIPMKKEVIKRKEGNQKIIGDILKENKQHKLQNILFSRQYTRYLLGMLTKGDKLDLSIQKKILKYAIVFYLTITIRQKNQGLNEFVLKRINKGIQKHRDLAQWALNLFGIQKIYDEFLINNPFRQTKKTLSFWLAGLYKICSPQIKRYFCNSLINKISSKGQNYLEVCIILYEIALSDKDMLIYLLKNNIIGRMMANITRQKSNFKDELQLAPNNESQIGYEEQIVQSASEQIRFKKLKQQESQNQYVWGLIVQIIDHSKQNHVSLKQIMPQLQYQSFYLNEAKIFKILEELKNKFAIYSFTRYISYLTNNNQPFLRIIMDLIFNGLKQFQAKRYRQFLLLTEQIINIKDEYLPLRFETLKKITQALKFNEQYSSDSNIIQQWIVILLNRNEHLRKYLYSEIEILDYLVNLPTKRAPSDEIAKKNKKYNDAMINKLHGVKFLYSKRAYSKLADQIRDFYKMIIDNTFEPSPLWPSTADNYLKEKNNGDKVSYFNTSERCQYEEATIQSIFLGKIELAQGKMKTFTIWKDDQKLLNQFLPSNDDEYSQGSSSRLTDELEEEEPANIDDS